MTPFSKTSTVWNGHEIQVVKEKRMQDFLKNLGQSIAVLGTQWGDEGKGKLVDALSGQFDIVCRSGGGSNAGHTIVVNGKKVIFHLLPSSMLHPKTIAVIGNGTVVNLSELVEEIKNLESQGLEIWDRIKLSLSSHIVFEYHKKIDAELERRKGDAKIGTTNRGIGPAYTDKYSRIGIRCEDLLDTELLKEKIKRNCQFYHENLDLLLNPEEEFEKVIALIERVKPFLTNTQKFVQDGLKAKKKILFEGAQGFHLDIDHGTYPFVTSSSTGVGGILTGLGIGPKSIATIIGITKAYTTRVGSGPFPSEIHDEVGEKIREKGHEFGSTTGRPRRCGWFDAVVVRTAIRTNDISFLNLTKLDVLSFFKEIKVATRYFLGETELFTVPTTRKANEKLRVEYETLPGWQRSISGIQNFKDLPLQAQNYILFLEKTLETQIRIIGTGEDRKNLIFRE